MFVDFPARFLSRFGGFDCVKFCPARPGRLARPGGAGPELTRDPTILLSNVVCCLPQANYLKTKSVGSSRSTRFALFYLTRLLTNLVLGAA